jgi:probable HAF family extracellular repeat protein
VGTSTQLSTLPTGALSGEATAVAVNAGGDIVGVSDALDAGGTLVKRAAVWTGIAPAELGTLIPDPANPGSFLGNSRAIDINDNGLVVGASDTAVGVEHAFLFDPSVGSMTDLGTLVGSGGESRATSINNNGDIVGVSDSVDQAGNVVERAFLIPVGAAMIDLGTLIPDPANPGFFLENSGAFGINDNGVIIGTSDAGGGTGLTGATQFFNPPSPISLLPTHSDGFDVGPANHVVGTFGANLDQGFVLHSSTGLVDLTVLTGTTIVDATGVNRFGQVTAVASIGGTNVGVLITP